MVKKTLIFDATVIADNLQIGRGRSGIYFTSFNILKHLINKNIFDVKLYCGNGYNKNFIDFIHNNFGENIEIYFGNRYGSLIQKLKILDSELRKKHRNITKLLLNIFVRKPLNIIGKVSSFPCFDIAFSPYARFNKRIKAKQKYIFLHDTIPLLFPEYYPEINTGKYWYNYLIEYIKTDKTCKYFANSDSTKNDFVKMLGVKPDNITVAPLAVSEIFYQEQDKKKIKVICKKYGIPDNKKYMFSLCTLEPRKNLIRVVKTFVEFIKKNNIDDMVFVLGGAHWDEFIEKLESEIKGFGEYKNKIIRAGYVADEDLASLYSGAEFFVYTSQYEGFGLPPLEAMKCGCSVITSNNSSLPEVVGNAAIKIDWDSDEQHIAAYEKYYFDKDYRDEMAKKGFEHSKQFSWDKTVGIIINKIQKS